MKYWLKGIICLWHGHKWYEGEYWWFTGGPIDMPEARSMRGILCKMCNKIQAMRIVK